MPLPVSCVSQTGWGHVNGVAQSEQDDLADATRMYCTFPNINKACHLQQDEQTPQIVFNIIRYSATEFQIAM